MERDETLIANFTRKLNEYVQEGFGPYGYRLSGMSYLGSLSGRHFWSCGGNDRLTQTDLISKECMFIEWLVKNKKIERKTFGEIDTMSSWYSDFELDHKTPVEDYINILLMELAINHEPIKLLYNIMK